LIKKPGSNMHKTDKFPKESESFFVKFLHEGGRGIRLRKEKKGKQG
jgi:hypothetical protein